jgi:hypothetical protein
MEPQQLSPVVGTAAASEASSTNGGTAGITVTEPDTSTMQKQAAGLSTFIFIVFACEGTVLYWEEQRGMYETAFAFLTFLLHWYSYVADIQWKNYNIFLPYNNNCLVH